MSRLRNRNIRTKIDAVAQWAELGALQNGARVFQNDGKTTTADSGVVSESLSSKFGQLKLRPKRGTWDEGDLEAPEPPDSTGLRRSGMSRRSYRDIRNRSDEDDADVSSECSSVDTLKVLDEIRNLEDSVKSMSAESYNSWNEEYENENTQLVKAEFERMERVLQCREPIPGNYDRDEYRLWIKTFPLLGLVSRSSLDNNKDQQNCDNTIRPPPLTPSPSKPWSTISASPEPTSTHKPAIPSPILTNSSTTTTYSNKLLAINSTINPRTTHINTNDSFLQLAPLNISTRRQSFKPIAAGHRNLNNRTQNQNASSATNRNSTTEWLSDMKPPTRNNLYKPTEQYNKHTRRKSSKTEPFKSTSEFIVLPPIEGKELRSSSAATITSLANSTGGNKMASMVPMGRLKHPPVYPLYENDGESDHNDGFVSYRHRKRKYK